MSDGATKALVLDTSVWINLLATEEASRILAALRRECLVPPQVLSEVKRDPVTKQSYSATSHPLLTHLPVEIVTLTESEALLFLELVGGPLVDRLGDGEAASIAVAVTRRATLVVDERKARRILRERFSDLPLLRSLDLFKAPEVVSDLGEVETDRCVERAIRIGRMHIT